MPRAKRLDLLQAIAGLANSDWARPTLYVLATPHFIYFSSLWVALPWLGCALALEALFLKVRAKAAGGDAVWRERTGLLAVALPWPWYLYSIVLWLHGGEAAIAGALCAQFTAAVVSALSPKADKNLLMAALGPPLFLVFAILATAYAGTLPLLILPIALCSALGICVVMMSAAQASQDSQQRLRQARAELKAERDALDERVRARTADLALATARAEAANLAKSQFLANMSHELRTPLNAVIGYAEIVIDDLKIEGRESSAQDVEKIRVAGRSLLALIDDVLDVAKADTKELVLDVGMTDIAALLRQTVEAAQADAVAKRNRIDLSIGAGVGLVPCDAARLQQALGKLMSNACKFTTAGVISLSAGVEGEWLAIRVRDTGVGIAPADMPALFQPFTQLDNSNTRRADGAGLGLVVTRNIARLMGGDVSIESELARGSTFTLRLPRAAPAAAVQAA